VPSDWIALANEYVDPAKANDNDKVKGELQEISQKFQMGALWDSISKSDQVYCVKESARISTYIYAIVAGPYDYFESIVEDLPPMRIYARKTLKKDINHEEMFLVT